QHRWGALEGPGGKPERGGREAEAQGEERREVLGLLVEGGLEVCAMAAVEQAALSEVHRAAVGRRQPEGVAVEGDPDPLGAHRGIAEIEDRVRVEARQGRRRPERREESGAAGCQRSPQDAPARGSAWTRGTAA